MIAKFLIVAGVTLGALLGAMDQAQAAALALGFVGTAIGGSIGGSILGISMATIGGMIGASIGGLIDNMLFNRPATVEGPRLNDLSVTASTYGTAIPIAYGPNVRLGGNIIWSSGLIETRKETKHGGKGGPGVTTVEYSYHVHLAIALTEGQLSGLKRIWGNGKVLFQDNGSGSGTQPRTWTRAGKATARCQAVRFYPGSFTQPPDTLMESFEGNGNVPGYRGTAYVVLQRLELADFGNTIPNLEFEIEAQPTATARSVVDDVMARLGIEDYQASQLWHDPVKGYVVARPATGWDALQPLGLAFSFDTADMGGQIRFVKRGGGIKATIERNRMGAISMAGDGGTARGDRIAIERIEDRQLPRSAVVSYRDIDLDLQTNSQRAERQKGGSQNALSVELALNLSADEARQIADRLLFEAWASRTGGVTRLTERYIDLAAADVVAVPILADGSIDVVRIERVTRTANGLVEIGFRADDPEVYRSTAPGQAGVLPPNELDLPGDTRLILIDASILLDLNDDEGFYWAVAGYEAGWRGTDIQRSVDGGDTFLSIETTGIAATIGDVTGTLAAGPSTVWDRGNTIVVELMRGGILESLTPLQVLAGGNAAWIGPENGQGGEYIQFTTATLIAPLTYELSGLLRGQMGTESAIGTHGTGEIFVQLAGNTIGRSGFSAADWNKERVFKPVSVYQEEDEAPTQTFTNTGEGKRPYAGVHPRGLRDGSNDLTLTWQRRTRLAVPGLGNGPVPVGEETQSYEVEILVGMSVVRTIAASTPQITYTAAQQAADGITPGNPVSGRIYQLSAVRGRGRPLAFTV